MLSVLGMPNNSFLELSPETIFKDAVYVNSDTLPGKWMKALLSPSELIAFEKLSSHPYVKRFKDVATVDVGIVTGANKFFLVDKKTVDKFRLEEYAEPMFGRSEHSPGIIYDSLQHEKNDAAGLPVNS